MTKRLFDLLLSVFLLIALAPALILIAIFIKATSKGHVLYMGQRMGLNGTQFGILKFRTMIPDAEAQGTTTAENDPRITGIGRFLRKTKLDELPQLLNVARGEMSFVGPRPEVEEHTNDYTDEEKLILTVRPGITDFSSIYFISLDEVLGSDNPHQVYVSRIRAEKNRLRLKYVREQSFFTDLNIIAYTAAALVRKLTGLTGK
jgi:lipopolysaccharide/colanic/teichoic acid biosynthesis glycosyltransferase